MRAKLSALPEKIARPWVCLLLLLAIAGFWRGPDAASALPVVSEVNPAAGATGVLLTSTVRATFSEPMDTGTITSGSFTLSQPVRISAIAAGYNYTLVLRENGTVSGWGNNAHGETTVPDGLNGVIALSAGSNHAVALQNDGTVVAWGANTFGQSTVPGGLAAVTALAAGTNFTLALKGDGTVIGWGDNSSGQTAVPGGLAGVSRIAAGSNHGLALKTDGTVVAWGDNSFNQISVPAGLSGVISVAAGLNHSLVLKADGTMVAWGANNKGQIDLPTGLSGVIAISAGSDYSVALKADGTVIVWGGNTYHQADVPAGLSGVTAISAGRYHAIALRNDGTVVSWGDNSFSQTTLPEGLSGITAVTSGSSHTVALKSDGTLFAWGYNSDGQAVIPSGISGVTAISAGFAHTLGLSNSGAVSAWGRNDSGQATVPADLAGVIAIAAGDNHSVAVKNDGTVVAWGLNAAGQATVPLGLSGVTDIAAGTAHTLALKQDGTLTTWGSNVFNATLIPAGLSGVKAIDAAGYHSVALMNDGTVTAWGDNTSGQNLVPDGLTGVIAIAAGNSHTVALKSDGTVVAWGGNDHGQSAVPEGLSGVVAIAAGSGFSVAVKNDGTLASWGDNTIGQSTVPQDPYRQAISASVDYSTGSNSVTISPLALLPRAKTLTATVNTGVRSLTGTHPAADQSWSFTTVSAPASTAVPAGGSYSSPQNVTLTASDPATIYYTTNGSEPTTASPVYTGPIRLLVDTILKFFARDSSANSEPVNTESYTISPDTTHPVTTAVPAGGTYSTAQNVTLVASEPATIYYTTNGSEPTTASPVYTGPIRLLVDTILKFFARDSSANSEPVQTENYTLSLDTTPPLITALPPGGTYSSAQSVMLTANEPATIYYTTNGSEPTTTSPVYTGPVQLLVNSILKFFARDTAGNSGGATTETYIIKQNQTISFAALPETTYGAPVLSLSATASSGLPVSYTSSNPAVATVIGAMVTIVGAGTTTITASQGGDADYNEAVPVLRTLTVNKAPLTVQAANATREYGLANPAFGATYSGFVNADTMAVLSGSPNLTTLASTSSPVGSYSITAAAGTLAAANYSFSMVHGALTITKAGQTISFAPLPAGTYGDQPLVLTATANSYLPISYTSSNPAVATVSDTTLTIVGAGTTTITASQGGDDNYLPVVAVAQLLTVSKAAANVTLASLNTAYDGTAKAATATTVPAGLNVTFTYNGTATAPTAVASYSVIGSVSEPNYQGSASGTLTIAKGDQTITFNTLPVKTYGDAAFALTASASSGLTVTYTSSNPAVATVSGSMLTIIAAGTATITALQAGDANYNAAPAAAQTLTVNKAVATIEFGQLSFIYDGNPKPVTVTTLPAGLAVTITYNGATTVPVEVGDYTVVATVNDSNYQGSATDVEEITKRSQTISFDPLPLKTYGDAPFLFNASASSKLNLTFEYDTSIATITKQGQKYLLTIVGAGTTIITATQAGNRNYSEAPPVSQTLVVNKAAGTVTLDSLSASYDGTAKAATALTSPAGLAVTFTYNGSATAPVAAGSYSVIGTMNDPNYQGSAIGTLVIAKTGQTITFAALPPKTYGNAPFNPNAAASSGLAIIYSSSNPAVATVSGTTVTIVAAGTTTITASQDGDGNFNPAVAVPQTLSVSKAAATVTLGSLSNSYNGTPRAATATTTPNGLPVSLTYNGSATAPTAAGTYAVAATVTSPNYQGGSSATLTIAKAAQSIIFGALPAKTVGNAPFTLTATATSGLAISYTSSNPAVATISGTTVTIVGAGSAVITASQSGDGNYEAAIAMARTLSVQAAQASNGMATMTIGAVTSYFDTLAATIAAINPGATANVKLQTTTFAEAVNLNVSGATVSIGGGYDSAFSSAAGMTTIQGSLVISAGTLIADRLAIM